MLSSRPQNRCLLTHVWTSLCDKDLKTKEQHLVSSTNPLMWSTWLILYLMGSVAVCLLSYLPVCLPTHQPIRLLACLSVSHETGLKYSTLPFILRKEHLSCRLGGFRGKIPIAWKIICHHSKICFLYIQSVFIYWSIVKMVLFWFW